jgi:hypothetical protein
MRKVKGIAYVFGQPDLDGTVTLESSLLPLPELPLSVRFNFGIESFGKVTSLKILDGKMEVEATLVDNAPLGKFTFGGYIEKDGKVNAHIISITNKHSQGDLIPLYQEV